VAYGRIGLDFGRELFLAFDVRVVSFFERVGLTVQPLFGKTHTSCGLKKRCAASTKVKAMSFRREL